MSDEKSGNHYEFHFHEKVGQSIAHVDTLIANFDKDMMMQPVIVDKVATCEQQAEEVQRDVPTVDDKSPDEGFKYVHPAIEEGQRGKIQGEIKRLVTSQDMQTICTYLTRKEKEGSVLLPPNPTLAYTELTRIGMPDGEGYSFKTFQKYYKK